MVNSLVSGTEVLALYSNISICRPPYSRRKHHAARLQLEVLQAKLKYELELLEDLGLGHKSELLSGGEQRVAIV